MRQITLRGIPEDIQSLVQEEARSKGISLNRAFLSLLRRGAQQQERARGKVDRPPRRFEDFKGLWTQEEADAFDSSLEEQRKVDPELWP